MRGVIQERAREAADQGVRVAIDAQHQEGRL